MTTVAPTKTLPCTGQTDLFYPSERDRRLQSPTVKQAYALCDSCEIKAECLDGALSRNERWGIWGGVDMGNRRRRYALMEQHLKPIRGRNYGTHPASK